MLRTCPNEQKFTSDGLRREWAPQTSEKHYNLCARGKTNIKGKGNMFTYWLDTSPQEPTEQVIQFRLEPIISGLDFAMMAEANRPSQQRRSTMPELSLARISLSETV